MISRRLSTYSKLGAVALVLGALPFVSPASAAPPAAFALPANMQRTLSEGALVRWFTQHPEQAPASMRAQLDKISALRSRTAAAPRQPSAGDFPMSNAWFNRDDRGLPQNEESVDRCSSNGDLVLSGTNDYRGLLNPVGNFTGWHFSGNGGKSLTKEGLLPAATFADRVAIPSGGDPVVAFDSACNAYMADLNSGFVSDTQTQYSGIAVYRTTGATLQSCPGGDDPTCWPASALADQNISADPTNFHFLDKPWMAVGTSAGQPVIWVTYTDFAIQNGFLTTTIKAVRCTADLTCAEPVAVSAGDTSVQFSDVTVGPDGRTYVSWIEDQFNPQSGDVFVIKLRVAEPGGNRFGPERVVTTELLPIPFSFLHADDFRAATYPKMDVKLVNGVPRVYVVWESCQARPLNVPCEFPRIRMTFSDSFGAGWSNPTTLSTGGDNYFVTLSANPGGANLAVAYWTSRFDSVFNNRQDIELLSVDPNGTVVKRQRLTDPSNEPEADPFLGGFFIGDYIEVTARGNSALVAFNANYRKEVFGLDSGVPVSQQDNYLVRAGL